jgi:hypothetical protein
VNKKNKQSMPFLIIERKEFSYSRFQKYESLLDI